MVVATSSYRDPKLRKLRAPAHDADALARVLGDPAIGNFVVTVLADETESKARRDIAAFFKGGGLDDVLLLHVASHGVKDEDGNLYFAATDTEMDNLDPTAVSAEFVNRQMTRSRSRRIVLLLDCCYSGAFASGMAHRADQGIHIRERFEGRGRVVLTASNSMEYAWEGDDLLGAPRPSVFTSALVRGLETGEADRDGDGYVSVDELYDYVFDQVRESTPNQTPGKWTFDLEGDLYIARSPRPAHPEAHGLPADLQGAVESPLAGVREGAVRELGRLLVGRDPEAAAVARHNLETLRDDDSRSVSEAAARILAEFDARVTPSPEGTGQRAGAAASAASPAPTSQRAEAWPPTVVSEGRGESSVGSPVGRTVGAAFAAIQRRIPSWLTSSALLGMLGAIALIAGGFSNWIGDYHRGTTIKAGIFFSAQKETGASFLASAGFVVILIGIGAMAGVYTTNRLVVGVAGILGIAAFVLAYRHDEVSQDMGIGMWLIFLGGATMLLSSFIRTGRDDGRRLDHH